MYTNTSSDGPRGSTETVTVRYEIGPEARPSTAFVRVIAELAEERPVDLGPLYEHVDLEALDDLLVHSRGETAWSPRVLVDVGGYSVSIDRSEITVEFTVGRTE